MEVAIVRSLLARRAVSGVSGLASAIVGLFGGDHDMANAGVTVGRPGRAMHLFLRPGAILADEGGIHAIYGCKGSGGLKPCLMCTNVYDGKSVREVHLHDPTGTAVPHTCADSTKFVPVSVPVLQSIFRQLRALSLLPRSKGKLEDLETDLGWTLAATNGLLGNARAMQTLYPAESCMWDLMHVLFASGVFGVHVGQLMLAAKDHGITYRVLDAAAQTFQWPAIGRKGLKPSDGRTVGAFTPKRAESHWEHVGFKATASESLALAPWLKYFFRAASSARGVPDFAVHARCFGQLVDIIEAVVEAHRVPVDTAALQRAVDAYLGEFKRLYGEDPMTPKFHYTIASSALPPAHPPCRRAAARTNTQLVIMATIRRMMMRRMMRMTTTMMMMMMMPRMMMMTTTTMTMAIGYGGGGGGDGDDDDDDDDDDDGDDDGDGDVPSRLQPLPARAAARARARTSCTCPR